MAAAASHILPTYARVEMSFERGEGIWLESTTGERFMDFTSGVAVNALGHAHPHLVKALTEQAQKVWHTSNLYRIPGGEKLADRLCEATFADQVFFTNSGAEALECSIKMARKYQAVIGHPERYRTITFEGAFHGRTLGTIAAGGNKKYLEGFGPPVEGFDQIAPGDIEAVKAAITPETGSILIEPVQGEGGVRVISTSFIKALRELCDQRGLLLILDEVQTGVGRTGELFAYMRSGITPDIMAIAKAIGGGFPLGACLATAEAAKGMTAGTHGSTYGGNPLAMACGNAVLDVVLEPGFMDSVRRKSVLLRQRLAEIKDRHPSIISEVRGEGLLIGLKAELPVGELVDALRAEGMITVAAGENVVRLLPPLIISEEEIAEAVQKIDRAATRIEQSLTQSARATA
ncbi:succinylornithine transaminase/acetylornithine aminotransferase [Variibacter gotjawalensis]|uniref:Acetylornithine aminotransferase n=1 Tax=Variibacter gotjawalensis TaxID=1333996 RepID=A0A0S3PQL2_9BRAD|nr:aspartate aminotransferase family protein [Variibacter gotjawalensis]NIK48378.1 acetylornithine/N-succinyldiaminopimelate aminotransferase [Variibacter gotjawalensis]RZS50245.1 acetylornithine/N-succinyldiaminopimelate aminotransferase [Variibacter gotjawalensis]BAT58078.1 succinylornithine transaminase/acetylornithine aminotransferase [Variibacter gotjawalensis]